MKTSDEKRDMPIEDNESEHDGEVCRPSSLMRCPDSAVVHDRISDLPMPIRSHILSFLRTKSAAQTCILSKSWTDSWRSVSCLDFDIEHGFNINRPDDFLNFVANVLRLHEHGSNIQHVRYACPTIPDNFFASLETKHVQVLDIAADNGDFTRLFAFSSLKVLKIKPSRDFLTVVIALPKMKPAMGLKSFIALPTVVYMRCLKTLHLLSVYFTADSFHSLFSGTCCPALETLDLVCCVFLYPPILEIRFPTLRNLTLQCIQTPVKSVIISAPNLSSLDYDGPPLPISFTDETVKLSKASLSPLFAPLDVLACSNFFQLIRHVQHCESLSLFNYEGLVGTVLYQNIDLLRKIQIPFLNLICLRITTSFYPGQLLLINTFLNNAPNVEILVLENDKKKLSSLESTKDEQWPGIECTMPHLKVVEIRRFLGCERGITFLKFLLRKALLLDKVVIEFAENGLKDGICERLETLPRIRSSIGTSTSIVLFVD